MDTLCRMAYDTTELPATLYIECVVQRFETGGKCHIFGFTMTSYCDHLSNYSIGRGVIKQLEDGGSQLIKPSQQMSTVCKALFPTDIHKDYDIPAELSSSNLGRRTS